MSIYMSFGNIAGSVTAQGYDKHIECKTVSFGNQRFISMPVGSGKEREVDKPALAEIVIEKKADKSTPYLFQESVAGKAIDKIEIKFVKTAKDNIETYMTYTLYDVLVSSYVSATEKEGDPEETVALNYTKFELKYHPRKNDNTLDSAIPVGYDLKLAKKT
jgi:type VI secretion system secreted protein Hcp